MEQRPCCLLQLLIDLLTQLLEYFLAGLTLLRGISTRLGCIATVSQRIIFIVHVRVHLAVKPLAAVTAIVAALGNELVHLVQGGQGRHTGAGCTALGAHAAGTVVVILARVNVGGSGIVFLQVYGARRVECAAIAPLLGCLQRLRFLTYAKQDVSVGKSVRSPAPRAHRGWLAAREAEFQHLESQCACLLSPTEDNSHHLTSAKSYRNRDVAKKLLLPSSTDRAGIELCRKKID